MAGTKGHSGGPRPNSGGKRPGAGRKPTQARPLPVPAATPPAPDAVMMDAATYLAAVVSGRVLACPLRLQAARTLIRYQQRARRAPLPAVTAQESERQQAAEQEREAAAEFQAKAALVRAAHGREE